MYSYKISNYYYLTIFISFKIREFSLEYQMKEQNFI